MLDREPKKFEGGTPMLAGLLNIGLTELLIIAGLALVVFVAIGFGIGMAFLKKRRDQ